MTNTDLATTNAAPLPPLVVFRNRLEARRAELKAALPSDIPPERFIRALVTAAQINPDVLACQWTSIWNAIMKACRDGLLPDGREGAIVPYKSTATWIPMYMGLLKRFRRSGTFRWVKADVVRAGEEFYHFIDEHGEHIRHTPGDNFESPIVKIYAMATTKDGGVFVNVMSIAEANKIRAMSRATRDDAPWKMWPEEMYRKTALRRLSKVLPAEGDMVDEELEELPEAPVALAPGALGPAEQPRAIGTAAVLDQFAASASAAGQDVARTTGGDAEDGGTLDMTTVPLASREAKAAGQDNASET